MHAFSKPNLLSSESATEFAAFRSELEHLIQPTDVIEWVFVADLLELIWEMVRCRRVRTGVIRGFVPAAIENLYKQLFHEQDFMKRMEVEKEAARIARSYFHDGRSKRKFLKILRRSGLEEHA